MKAILLSLPFAAIFLFLISLMYGNEHEILKPSASFYPLETRVLPNAFSFTDILFAPIIDAQRLALFAPYLCLTIVLFHLLRSACINHFSAEAGSRWLRQAGWLTGLTLASLIFCLSFSLRAGIF